VTLLHSRPPVQKAARRPGITGNPGPAFALGWWPGVVAPCARDRSQGIGLG